MAQRKLVIGDQFRFDYKVKVTIVSNSYQMSQVVMNPSPIIYKVTRVIDTDNEYIVYAQSVMDKSETVIFSMVSNSKLIKSVVRPTDITITYSRMLRESLLKVISDSSDSDKLLLEVV